MSNRKPKTVESEPGKAPRIPKTIPRDAAIGLAGVMFVAVLALTMAVSFAIHSCTAATLGV